MIAEIENAMIALHKALQDSGVLPYKLKTLKTYGGEFSEGLEREVKNMPAILIIYAGGPITPVGSKWKVTCRFLVMCAAGNLRNEVSARHGSPDGIKVGSYQLALDVVKIFNRQKFGLDIAEMVPTNIRGLANDGAGSQLASVYGVDFQTSFITDSTDDLGDGSNIGLFETLHANWDVPVIGNVREELPDDDHADATDHINLPQ